MRNLTIGFAFTGSFCTFAPALAQLEALAENGPKIIPIMSFNAATIDSRFGKAEDFKARIREITGNEILDSIGGAEPIGPKKLLDLLIIAPCTGNTLAKIALGITDTPVTMAAKAHLRNARPLLIAIATNDALSANAKNLGVLLNTRNVFFVPFSQDDCWGKSTSIVADFSQLIPAAQHALEHKQLQPLISGTTVK